MLHTSGRPPRQCPGGALGRTVLSEARGPGHWQPGLKEASVSRGHDAAGRTLVLLQQTHSLGARVLPLWAQPEQPREGGSGGLGAAEA